MRQTTGSARARESGPGREPGSIPASANSAGATPDGTDWRANAVCDALVVRRACAGHAQGQCQFNHDEAKAAEIRSNAAERARIQARLEKREQTRRGRQAKPAPAAGGSGSQRQQSGKGGGGSRGGRSRGGRGSGAGGNKKLGSANAAAAEADTSQGGGSTINSDPRYGGARVMRLGSGGGSGAGNCAQRYEAAQTDQTPDNQTIDRAGVRADRDRYGGALHLRLGSMRTATANAVCSIVCCVTGRREDSDDEAPADGARGNLSTDARYAGGGGPAQDQRQARQIARLQGALT